MSWRHFRAVMKPSENPSGLQANQSMSLMDSMPHSNTALTKRFPRKGDSTELSLAVPLVIASLDVALLNYHAIIFLSTAVGFTLSSSSAGSIYSAEFIPSSSVVEGSERSSCPALVPVILNCRSRNQSAHR